MKTFAFCLRSLDADYNLSLLHVRLKDARFVALWLDIAERLRPANLGALCDLAAKVASGVVRNNGLHGVFACR